MQVNLTDTASVAVHQQIPGALSIALGTAAATLSISSDRENDLQVAAANNAGVLAVTIAKRGNSTVTAQSALTLASAATLTAQLSAPGDLDVGISRDGWQGALDLRHEATGDIHIGIRRADLAATELDLAANTPFGRVESRLGAQVAISRRLQQSPPNPRVRIRGRVNIGRIVIFAA